MSTDYQPEKQRFWLRFTDGQLERDFALHHNKSVQKLLKSGIIQAIAIWFSGFTTLYFIAPYKFDATLITAIVYIFSLFGFILYATSKPKMVMYYDRLSMLSNASAGILIIITFKGLDNGDILMLPTMVFNVFFGSYLLRLRLTSAIIGSAAYLVTYEIYVCCVADLSLQTKIVLSFLTLLTQIFAITSAYLTESTSRALFINKRTIKKQQQEVDRAYLELEIKNHEMLDSIAYAKRIQHAILPPDRIIKEFLPESFVLYLPKDIVAGDFYWLREMGDSILFGVADCTGHGVPGAMVSVICHSGLNSAVRDYHLQKPAQILDRTRELVIEEFEKSDEEVKDGMDIALCALKGNKLQFSGANNPLWILRNGELIEYNGDKWPVGKFVSQEGFTNHEIELQSGDSLYLFSDGFVDQFGGPKEKKFKTRAFKSLILSIQDLSMEEQGKRLNEAFCDWKGDFPQVDDVCVMGIKIS